MEVVLQLIYAMMGTFGFCLIFNVEKRHLIVITLGGALCWGAFLFFKWLGFGTFPAGFSASAIIGICGEILSRLLKMPTTVFDIPACVPLIPGSNLYYALYALIAQDWDGWKENTVLLLLYAMGIATGLAVILELDHIRCSFIRKYLKT